MKEITINTENFDYDKGIYVTTARDRSGKEGILIFKYLDSNTNLVIEVP